MTNNENTQEEVQPQEAAPEAPAVAEDSWESDFAQAWGDRDVGAQEKQLVEDILRRLVAPEVKGVQINKKFLNDALDALDNMIGEQLDEVLHNEQFKKLEAAWTGLGFMVQRTDFDQNIRVDIISATKKEMLDDFQDAMGDVSLTGLYRHIYASEFGMPNGKPFGAMIMAYEISNSDPDIALLSSVAEVANMAHAPVLTAIAPEFFGPKGFEHLTDAKYAVSEALESPEYTKWHAFRDDENSRYVGMAMPRFMLRTPYDQKNNPTDEKEFKYQENIDGKHENYLWGNAAFAVATRLTASFSEHRWYQRVVGEESGGAIEGLNVHNIEEHGETVQKPPTEFGLDFRKGAELTEAGMIPLLWLKEKDVSVMYRMPSAKKPLEYPDTPEGNAKQRDEKLRTVLPNVFVLTRMAHYLKRLQTAYIGRPVTKLQLKTELDEWIKQYVNANQMASDREKARRPLRSASISVEEDPKSPGTFLCNISITPWASAEEITTTLSLVSSTDLSGE